MNQQNLDNLKTALKYLGFEAFINDALTKAMEEDMPEFQLQYSRSFGVDTLHTTLYFKKSGTNSRYYFNKYMAVLNVNGIDLQQHFYVDFQGTVTTKEAFNLLQGRAVYKELTNKGGEIYKAWLQLDFENKDNHGNYKVKQYHDNYGFNLIKVLEGLSIGEFGNEKSKDILIQSLQKGNLHPVTLLNEKETSNGFAAANPQYKKVNLYDTLKKPAFKKVTP